MKKVHICCPETAGSFARAGNTRPYRVSPDLVGADHIRPNNTANRPRYPPQQRRERSEYSRKETLVNTVKIGQLFSGVGRSTLAQDCAALRFSPLIFCQADAGNTPVLRTEGYYIPKVRQTFFFFTDQTAIFLLMFQKKNGGLEAASLRAHPSGPVRLTLL